MKTVRGSVDTAIKYKVLDAVSALSEENPSSGNALIFSWQSTQHNVYL